MTQKVNAPGSWLRALTDSLNAAAGGESEMMLLARASDRLHPAKMADRTAPHWAYWFYRLLDKADPNRCEKSRPKEDN
jgi:hypothetical protein